MAAKSEGIFSSYEQLRKDVTCPKCQKAFVHPKLLPCLHSACSGCLQMREGIRDREGLRYIVSCPLCAEETELPKSGLSSLPTSYFKQNMTMLFHILEVVEGERGQSCDECQRGQPGDVSTFCSVCGLICDSCTDNHQSMRSFASHAITRLKGANVGGVVKELQEWILASKPKSDDSAVMCMKHSKPLSMYCRTCKRLTCEQCAKDTHKSPDHQCSPIQQIIKSQREEMKQYLKGVQEVFGSSVSSIDSIHTAQEELSKQKKNIEDTINSSFKELFRQLTGLKVRLLDSAQKATEGTFKQLSEELESAKETMSKLDNLAKVTEQSLEYTTNTELLSLKWYMVTRLKEVTAQNKTSSSQPPPIPALNIPLSCGDELMRTTSEHINQFYSISHANTLAMGNGIQKAEIGKQASFTICVLTHSGSSCIERQDVEVSILMPRTGDIVAANVTPAMELGTYNVSYHPKVKGQYKISVRVSGKEISGSPYFVTVKPSKLEWAGPVHVYMKQEWPWGVACGPNRTVYITRNFQHTIVILDKDGHTLKTVGLKGQRPGHLFSPTGIAVDKEGYIFVADGHENGRVQKFNASGQFVNVHYQLSNPHGVMLNKREDRVYVCDRDNRVVVILDNNLQLVKLFGELKCTSDTDGYDNISGHMIAPHSIAEDKDGNIYVTDIQDGAGCIHVFSEDGVHSRTIKHPTNEYFSPAGICIEDDKIYVCDSADNCLVVFNIEGELVSTCGFTGTDPGQFQVPLSMAVDLDGFLYVTDHCNARVQVF